MKIENKELLKNSIFQLEKTLELLFSYNENTKQKILNNNLIILKKIFINFLIYQMMI